MAAWCASCRSGPCRSTLQAAYLPRSNQIPAIRALIDFLVEALQRPSGETGPAYRRARE